MLVSIVVVTTTSRFSTMELSCITNPFKRIEALIEYDSSSRGRASSKGLAWRGVGELFDDHQIRDNNASRWESLPLSLSTRGTLRWHINRQVATTPPSQIQQTNIFFSSAMVYGLSTATRSYGRMNLRTTDLSYKVCNLSRCDINQSVEYWLVGRDRPAVSNVHSQEFE